MKKVRGADLLHLMVQLLIVRNYQITPVNFGRVVWLSCDAGWGIMQRNDSV